MLTNREVIGEFRVILKKNNKDSEMLVSDRWILSRLKNIALLFIKQRTDRLAIYNNPSLYITIPCISLKSVPLGECCNYHTDCTIKRSVWQLPKIAQASDTKLLIQGLWSIDTISRRFIEGDANRYTNSLGLEIPNPPIMYWIQDYYLYLGDSNIEKVKISASFEEDIPQKFFGYPTYCNETQLVGCCPASSEVTDINDLSKCCPTNPYDNYFPCPGYLIPDIMKVLEKEFMEVYGRSPEANKTTGIENNAKL